MFDCESVLEALNTLTVSWKRQFAQPPAEPLVWVERDGVVWLDGLAVCAAARVDPENLYFDPENLWICTVEGGEICLHAHWPSHLEPVHFTVKETR